MESFSKKVATKAGTFDFIFCNDAAANKRRYTVTIMEDDYVSQPFIMEEKGETWKITGATEIPLWIYMLEADLANAIDQSREPIMNNSNLSAV